MVKILDDILAKIAEYICGDNNDNFPYRTGRDISLFFGGAGLSYSHDGSTRKWWTLDVLRQLNIDEGGGLPSRELTRAIEYIVAPQNSNSQNQRNEQILTLNHLIKQFNLELAYINENNKVLLLYHNKATRQVEYYEENITVIGENIRRIKAKLVDQTEETKSSTSLNKQSEENIAILTKIEKKIDVFSEKTDYKLDSIKEDTEQILEEISQLEVLFDRIDDLESFLIKSLGSDFRKIKYAWDQYKEGKVNKKGLAKECFKALGRQVVKKIWKSV